jgi:hypothetical protein
LNVASVSNNKKGSGAAVETRRRDPGRPASRPPERRVEDDHLTTIALDACLLIRRNR